MEKVEIIFNYNGTEISLQADTKKKFTDIYKNFSSKTKTERKTLYFMYNGNVIRNYELKFNDIANEEDKRRKKMNILVNESNEENEVNNSQREVIIKSKNIICPKCKEDILIKIEDYMISLYDCKNNHKIDKIFLSEFESTQTIDLSKIICQNCKKFSKANVHNKTFYICNSCNINLCPICYSNHNKKHLIIFYDDRNYKCKIHNKIFTEYCKECKKNLCIYCERNHKGHTIESFGKLIPDENKLNDYNKFLSQLKGKINKLKEEVNAIINELNEFQKNIENYYDISEKIIQNYDEEKINFEILHNVDNIINNQVIKDLENIINNSNIQGKFEKIIEIYNKMNKKSNEIIIKTIPMKGVINMKNPPKMDMMNPPMKDMMNPPMMGMMNHPMMGKMNHPMYMMNNMDMPINPINMIIPTMNPLYSKDTASRNLSIEDKVGWNLIFENNRVRINIVISERKLVKDAIDMYRVKTRNKENCIFIYNNRRLPESLTIAQSGLINNSRILVLSLSNVCGAIQIHIHEFPMK